jgi:anti-sigma factor RsiW
MSPTSDRDDRLAGYLLDELDDAERVALEHELGRDPALRAELERLRATLALAPLGAAVTPPAHLRARILAAARVAERPARARRAGMPWSRIVGTLAAGLALALGFDDYRLRRERALEREVVETLQQPNVVLSFGDAPARRARRAASCSTSTPRRPRW